VALPAFAAERRAAATFLLSAGQQSIDISCRAVHSAANLQQQRATGEWWDRRTDGQTDRRRTVA